MVILRVFVARITFARKLALRRCGRAQDEAGIAVTARIDGPVKRTRIN
jgi:hypothetical protein